MMYSARIFYSRFIKTGQKDVFNNPITIIDRGTSITLPPEETREEAVELAKRWIKKLPLYSVPGKLRKSRGNPQIEIIQINGLDEGQFDRIAVQQIVHVRKKGSSSQRLRMAIIFDI